MDGAPRAGAERLARGVRLPRGRGARPRRDGRLPALRRRARGRAVHLERRGGRARAAELGPRPRPLRRQRRRAPARRDGRPHPRRRRRPGSRARRRLPRRLPDPRLRSRRPDRLRGAARLAGAGRAAARGDRRRRARTFRSSRRAFRLRPVEPVEGRRVALFTTAPEAVARRIARRPRGRPRRRGRPRLGEPLAPRRAARRPRARRASAEVYLVEIKAAAIDVVAEAAAERGIPTVFCDNAVERARRRAEPRRGARAASPTPRCARGRPRDRAPRLRRPRRPADALLPYSKGLMARALMGDGPRARARVRARAADRDGARRGARRGAGHPGPGLRRGRSASSPSTRTSTPSAGCAATRASRRSSGRSIILVGGATGTGKSHDHDRGRAPARDHARHLDGLRPPDDAGLLLRGVHAVDPLLELRGGRVACRRPSRAPTTRTSAASSTRRGTSSSASTRVMERALTENHSMALEGVHLVPGMVPSDARGRDRLPVRDRDLRTRRTHARHFFVRDADSEGCGPSRSTCTRCPRSGGSRTTSSSGPRTPASP